MMPILIIRVYKGHLKKKKKEAHIYNTTIQARTRKNYLAYNDPSKNDFPNYLKLPHPVPGLASRVQLMMAAGQVPGDSTPIPPILDAMCSLPGVVTPVLISAFRSTVLCQIKNVFQSSSRHGQPR